MVVFIVVLAVQDYRSKVFVKQGCVKNTIVLLIVPIDSRDNLEQIVLLMSVSDLVAPSLRF